MYKVPFVLVFVSLVYACTLGHANSTNETDVNMKGSNVSNPITQTLEVPVSKPSNDTSTNLFTVNSSDTSSTSPLAAPPHNKPTTSTITTTLSPPNTTSTSTTTLSPPHTTSTSTTTLSPPNTTSTIPPPAPTQPSPPPTAHPTPTPQPEHGFSLPSFLGGFILGLGLLAIAYVVFKFYKNRGDLSYRTL